MLALALAVGLMTHGFANPDMGLKATMAAATSDMPMSGNCDGCGDNSTDMAAACAAFCNSAIALVASRPGRISFLPTYPTSRPVCFVAAARTGGTFSEAATGTKFYRVAR